MRILPVIDLMQGQVVRGVAGERSNYRPIESRLAQGSDPVTIAAALVSEFSFRDVYLADLDAIQGGPMATSVYAQLQALGLQLWVDAGTGDAAAVQRLLDAVLVERLIVGLESLSGWGALESVLAAIGPERLVFSLDLKDGRLLSSAADWRDSDPLHSALAAVERGVRRMIVLDLAAVGVRQGLATLELCRAIRQHAPDIELVSGGGVRNANDLELLRAAGCDAALVATALHDGRMTQANMSSYGNGYS